MSDSSRKHDDEVAAARSLWRQIGDAIDDWETRAVNVHDAVPPAYALLSFLESVAKDYAP